MSQMNPPAPPPPGSGAQDAFDAEMMPSGPAPMSGMAVAGFVSAVIVCCPILSPLLGLIFSLVGLAQTRGGVRRGRGLAIAGLVVAVVFVPIHLWGVVWFGNVMASSARLRETMFALRDSSELQTSAIYDLGSPGFQARVTETALQAWIDSKIGSLGDVESLEINPNQPFEALSNNRLRYHWVVEFQDDSVELATEMVIDLMGGTLYLEDVLIDGASVFDAASGDRDALPDAPPDEAPATQPADQDDSGGAA